VLLWRLEQRGQWHCARFRSGQWTADDGRQRRRASYSLSPEFLLDEVRPRLIETVRAIEDALPR